MRFHVQNDAHTFAAVDTLAELKWRSQNTLVRRRRG